MKPRHLLWLLACLVIGIAIPTFLSGTQLLPTLAQISSGGLIILVGFICLSWLLQGSILLILLSAQHNHLPTKWRLLPYFLTAQLMNKISPLGSGELAIGYLLSKHYNIPVQRVVVSLLAVFILSLSTIACWCCVIVIIDYTTHQTCQLPFIWLLLALTISLLALALLFRQKHRLVRLLLKLFKQARVRPAVRFKSARSLLRLTEGMDKLARLPQQTKTLLLLLSGIYWGLILSILWASIRLLGGSLGWVESTSIQVIATAGGHLSLLPSGLVGTEAITAWLLTPLLGSSLTGAAILLWRGVLLYLPMLVGAGCLLVLYKQRQGKAQTS